MIMTSSSSRYQRLLVFDTFALLSADNRDPVHVWRDNRALGRCYVPGATYAEIDALAKNSQKPQWQNKAKAFINFASSSGSGYHILSIEDNRRIPVSDYRDRQILACAHNLATENPNDVVILVTYERAMLPLVKQAGLPNLCALEAKELGKWFHQLRDKGKVPEAVWEAQGRMIRASGNNNFPPLPSHQLPGHQQSTRLVEAQSANPPILQPSARNTTRYPEQELYDQRSEPNRFSNPWIIGVAATAVALLVLLGFGAFTRRESDSMPKADAIIPQAVAAAPKPLQPTPPSLVAEAEASIIQFQRNEDPSVLRRPLNALQELKNLQGGKLDAQGEQGLSRLKHKYAIEVLATSGQLAEASKILREISQDYSDIQAVREWLVKQNR
jgi:PIN domain